MYFIKTPILIQKLFPDIIWRAPKNDDSVYLTFDDGPSESTHWLLDVLAENNIKATFFCLGKNIEKYPKAFDRMIAEGHQIGNHSYSHLDGWKNSNITYLEDVNRMQALYNTKLLRPPYGRITPNQYRSLKQNFCIVMWNRMPGDFDPNISSFRLELNLREAFQSNNLIVLHDHKVAFQNLKHLLPQKLKEASEVKFANQF